MSAFWTLAILFEITALEEIKRRCTLIPQKMTELQLFELGPNLTTLAIEETAYFLYSEH